MSEHDTLFTAVAACPATREALAGSDACPLACGIPVAEHEPEDADVLRDTGDSFYAWLLSLPRSPA